MKTTTKLIISLAFLVLGCLSVAAADLLAFPGAQGWGRFATGGRTGKVYHVTNLNDSGTGSLRDAVSQPNRIVVFDVAGVIRINSRIVFAKNLYVAGQTAPGEGVTVYGNGVSFSGAENIIVRYMRFRMGRNGDSGKDCAGIANGQNMIFDHCSFAWGQDETFSINPDGKGTTPQNITLQHCVVGQGLMTHSAGGLMQTNYVSLIGNFLCDNNTRNFKVKGINQYANNMVYNWSNGAYIMGGDSEGKSYVNIESNLFINGPAKGGAAFTGGNADFHCYGHDNWQDQNMDGVFNPQEITDYNAATRESKPYDYPALDLNPGRTLLETNLPTVGASLPYRDPVDCYMADEVLSYGKQGALISNEESMVYGTPSTWQVFAGQKPADTDGDGMPDEWEQQNGTNPQKDDAMTKAANGYANIENYINGISQADRTPFLRTPVALEAEKTTTQSISIAWRDYTEGEDGFLVEIKTDGTDYHEVATIQAGARQCVITGLEPGTRYTVRVSAFNGSLTSGYATTSVSTRPLEVGIIDVESFTGEGEGEWLINPTADETITLNEPTEKTAVVVRSDANITISGTGAIAGKASMNKAGTGILTLNTQNTYTGATVLHDGVLAFATLKNGGQPSAIGSSAEFAQNWVANGGTYRYTGATTATNRSMKLMQTTTLDIAKPSVVVTMNGTVEGTDAKANLTLDGQGQLTVGTSKFFGYKGATVLRGATLYLSTTAIAKAGIGSSSRLVMAGGHLKTNGENDGYETYSFPIEVTENTVSQFSPHRNCYMDNKVSGRGTLQLNIPYLREYIRGDWSAFSGRLLANGVSGDKSGSLLLLDKQPKMNNTVIELRGNARLCYWSTNGSQTIGGLSGAANTYLMGSSKNTATFTCTWSVGAANSDETFRGIINNWDCTGNDRGGTTHIVKVGTGNWRLTGANTYRGTTKVNAGTLTVNGSHTGTGAVTVAKDATLAGKGTLTGAVTLNAGAILQVGDTLATDRGLTFKSGLKLSQGTILQLNEAMAAATYTAGASIRVFTGTVTGTFAEILPATPGEGLEWDTTELYTKGLLKVVNATAVQQVGADTTPVHTEFYTLSGERMEQPAKSGLYIERSIDARGQHATVKYGR